MTLNAETGIICMIRTKIQWENHNVKLIVNAMADVNVLMDVAVDGLE